MPDLFLGRDRTGYLLADPDAKPHDRTNPGADRRAEAGRDHGADAGAQHRAAAG